MSAQHPTTPGPPDPSQSTPDGTMRCPRCSATLAAEQDWCLDCGAPARTRLAPTPKWQIPTIAIGAIVLVAGALLAFAFAKLTQDDGATSTQTAPVIATQPAPVPPVVAPTAPTQTPTVTTTTPSPTQPTAPPTTVPGQPPAAGSGAATTPKTTTAPSPKRERKPR